MESFIKYYPFNLNLNADPLEMKVRLSIFTIISVCAGLPVLVWSVRDLLHHRKNGHRISVFIILLLLTDFVEIFLSPYILLKHLFDEIEYLNRMFWISWSFWEMSRDCGLLLNQLVALEETASANYPLYSAISQCLIIFYILLFTITFFWHFYFFSIEGYLLIVAVVLVASVITLISVTCVVSCPTERHSHTSRKPDHHIAVVFMFTLLVLYLPYVLVRLFLNLHPLLHIPLFLMSVRLISDPLLCVLVSRQNIRMKTYQNPEASSLVT